MPPKAASPKSPQKKTSKPKQGSKDKKNQEDVTDKQGKIFLEKKYSVEPRESVATDSQPNFDETQGPDIMERFGQKKDDVLEKAIAEVELEGSSFSEGDSEEEEIEFEQPFGLLEHPSKFIKCDFSSEEEEEDEEPDILHQGQVDDEETFFQAFGVVPDVDELSMDQSEKIEVKEPEHKTEVRTGDKGIFVNPLTGQIYMAPATAEPEIQDRISVKSETLEDTRRSRDSLLSSDADVKTVILDKDEDRSAANDGDDHEKFLMFLELETQKEEAARAEADTAIGDLLKQQQDRVNYEQAMEFLNNLIDLCVEKAEYIDGNVILRKNLDKNKLMQELKAKLDFLDKERKILQFLNRKCAEFFRRKSAFSKMIADNTSTNQRKYYESLKMLDEWLIKDKNVKRESAARLQECREEYEIVKEKFEYEVQRLEQLIRSTFHKEKFDKLKSLVSQKLEYMSVIRNEISRDRTKLLIQQHDASKLRQQLTKLEDLGNGLYIKDYETLETETSALDKKVEERNTTLTKLHNHLNSDIHNVAHLKEKQKMTRQMIDVQKQILNDLQLEKKHLRKYITELKVKKNCYRSDIRQISFQCGLLDKPVLMRDYDRTEITINNLRITNEDLKKQADSLSKKIALLEDMSNEKIHANTDRSPQNIL